ncbi:MAG: hypothetical protein ACRYG4_04105 [Janthinobacterium lividum]
MAKFIAVVVEDASLDAIALGVEMYFCNGQPVDRASAIAQKSTAVIPLTSADFSKANGATGVRVLTVAAKSATGTVAQTADHVAICSSTALLYVTTSVAQTVNVGAAVNSAAFTVQVGPLT